LAAQEKKKNGEKEEKEEKEEEEKEKEEEIKAAVAFRRPKRRSFRFPSWITLIGRRIGQRERPTLPAAVRTTTYKSYKK
jgi:hypothetical protein